MPPIYFERGFPVMAKNETAAPTQLTDEAMDQMAQEAGDNINTQPKVRIRIPKDPLNPTDDSVPVNINGYTWQIKRGESVEVPKVVAFVLEEAGYI